jgi:lipopolysaccharide/colanic/teichoic acid biosynthesis glycosyltransferase
VSAGRIAKRALDVLGSSAVLVGTSPVLVAIALSLRATIGAPVVFRQRRPGLHGRPFHVAKFRTMSNARDASGNLLPDEARLSRLGRVLRATSLDELPQLWNVLCGDMSLVGPRPLMIQYLGRYDAEQARRHDVLPGITGWAQVHGRNAIGWPEKLALDVWYVDHWTFWLDAKILALTVLRVLQRQGISREGHATMPEFMGNSDPAP